MIQKGLYKCLIYLVSILAIILLTENKKYDVTKAVELIRK